MSIVDDMDPDSLRDNITRRDTVIDTLKTSLKELNKNKEKLDGMGIDGCHMTALYFLKARYGFIIKNIDEMIDFMNKGDWCLSVESTKKKEEEMRQITGR